MEQGSNIYTGRVVITGGSGGIGRAIASRFARAGAHVILLARNKQRLIAAQKEISKFGTCEIYSLDVTKQKAVKSLIDKIFKKYKRIDAVINTAGVLGPVGEFHTNKLDDWKSVVDTNLYGTANVCHAVLPYMVKRKQGSIVNFSGGGAVQPFANFSGYAASKAAVVRFTENLAKEYVRYGICINAVAPGAVNTKFLADMFKAGVKKAGKEYYEKMLQQKKSGGDSPDIAAELIFALCTGGLHNLTGKLLSAKWDPWKEITQSQTEKLNSSSDYTLRRIDNQFYFEKK